MMAAPVTVAGLDCGPAGLSGTAVVNGMNGMLDRY
jgi:hypothetical protein